MSTVNAWYFKAGNNSVKMVQYKNELGHLRELLNCKRVDCKIIHTPVGQFNIWFNDNGIYEECVFNKPASQVIGKLPIRWGTMNGNFLVTCSNDTGRIDMPDISFKDWITMCSTIINDATKERIKKMYS